MYREEFLYARFSGMTFIGPPVAITTMLALLCILGLTDSTR